MTDGKRQVNGPARVHPKLSGEQAGTVTAVIRSGYRSNPVPGEKFILQGGIANPFRPGWGEMDFFVE